MRVEEIYHGTISTPWGEIGTPDANNNFLYQFYNLAGDLLYVGYTYDIRGRWQTHRRKKSWWHEVASARVHQVTADTRLSADLLVREIESAAILHTLPLKNLAGPRNLPSKRSAA